MYRNKGQHVLWAKAEKNQFHFPWPLGNNSNKRQPKVSQQRIIEGHLKCKTDKMQLNVEIMSTLFASLCCTSYKLENTSNTHTHTSSLPLPRPPLPAVNEPKSRKSETKIENLCARDFLQTNPNCSIKIAFNCFSQLKK